MAECTLNFEEGKQLLRIRGEATIDQASLLHALFLEARDAGFPLSIDTSEMVACDLSFLQLLSALCRSVSESGGMLEFYQNKVAPPLQDAVESAGFSFKEQCTALASKASSVKDGTHA